MRSRMGTRAAAADVLAAAALFAIVLAALLALAISVVPGEEIPETRNRGLAVDAVSFLVREGSLQKPRQGDHADRCLRLFAAFALHPQRLATPPAAFASTSP